MKNARSRSGSLSPGAASVPLAVSTANGVARTPTCRRAIASATLSGRRPPLRISGTLERRARSSASRRSPPCRRAAPARRRARAGIEQVEVDVEALELADVADRRHLHRLDHLRAAAARHLGAVRRPSSPCSCSSVSPSSLAVAHDPLQRRVDEHAAQLHPAAQRARDPQRLRLRAAAGAVLVEDHAHRPRPQLDRQLGVLEAGDAADLHARGVARSCPHVGHARRAPMQTPRAGACECARLKRLAPCCYSGVSGRGAARRVAIRACSGWEPSSGAGRA